MSPKFSIIIPTCNVAPYIARALESCINQTLSDIEILVIDDCGSDDSIKIAKGFASKDSRIRIIHNKENLGLFQARIKGEKEAKGTYILCLDGDDYLERQTCQTLQNIITQTNADIIHFKAIYQGEADSSMITNCAHKLRYILPTQMSKDPLYGEAIVYNFFLKSYHFPKFTIWDKCYKSSLIQRCLPYLESIQAKPNMAEDMLQFFVIASLAKSYVSTDSRLYHHCLNHTSITQNLSEKKLTDMAQVGAQLEILADILKDTNPYAKQIATRMNDNLCALMLLESRYTRKHKNTTPIDANNANRGGATKEEIQEIMTHLWAQAQMRAPSLKHITTPYLKACFASLTFWNRNLTYVRIAVFILTLGYIKL